MEAAMPAEERQTHRNLQVYFMERAKAAGVKEQKEEDEDDDDPEMLALIGDGTDAPEGGEGDKPLCTPLGFDDSKKKKKDIVQLNAKEKLQVQNLIKNMIYGESGKNKSITTGWVNLIDEKEIPRLTPWEFQLAHIMRTSMALEYSAKKKKERERERAPGICMNSHRIPLRCLSMLCF
eukprot:g6652.t1